MTTMIAVDVDTLIAALKGDASLGASAPLLNEAWKAMAKLREQVSNTIFTDANEPVASLVVRKKGSLAGCLFISDPEVTYDPDLYDGPFPVFRLPEPTKLDVWEGMMPESNGKSNYTVILHNGDVSTGITLYRSEYPGRASYEADVARWLIGQLPEKPLINEYNTDKHSGWLPPGTVVIGDTTQAFLMELFFKKMSAKMELSRNKGRQGWENLTREQMSEMLHEHVAKGDPVDVANFCFMLSALGMGIAAKEQK